MPLIGFSQETVQRLQVNYYKGKEKEITEIIKQKDCVVEIKTKSSEYIEFINLSGFPYGETLERYSLNHENYNSDTLLFSFYDYKNLEEIELKGFEKSSVTYVEINGVKLKKFPAGLTKLKELKCLEIYNKDFDYLHNEISHLEKLERLCLGHTSIKKLPVTFNKLQKLSYLNINYNSIEDKILFLKHSVN